MNMEITSGPTLPRYSLSVSSCPHELDVERFEGLEQLSVRYHYSVRFTCSASELTAGMFLNQPALLTMKGGELLHALPVKFVHGVVTHFRRLTESRDQVSHEIIIEPYLSLLDKQFRTHRFFINKSVPEVVGEILQEHALHGWEYDFTLTQSYPKREQINQYQESDLAFIERLLAEVGIFYFFTLQPDTRTEVVHFADQQSAYEFDKRLTLNSPSGMSDSGADSVWGLNILHQVAPAGVTTKDYNHREAQKVLQSARADIAIPLLRDEAAQHLTQELTALTRLAPDSSQFVARAKIAYNQLKMYLMLSRPEQMDASFFSQALMQDWPDRAGISRASWQGVGPGLWQFWGEHLQAHPEWKITADKNLINQVRTLLIRQMGIRNGEAALYQKIIEQVTPHYTELRLEDMTGDKAALEWLAGGRMLDSLARFPEVSRPDTQRIAGALMLLEQQFSQREESIRPGLGALYSALENRLAQSGGAQALVPQNVSPQAGRHSAETPVLKSIASGRELLEQARVLAKYLSDQPDGWLAAHHLMKSVRLDTVNQLPPPDGAGRTRLVPPKSDYRAQLKRLYLQQSWTELIELTDSLFAEGVNHFWLDVQWYLHQALTRAGSPWDKHAAIIISDLKMLLHRMPGLETLAFNDGTPFADDVTREWIARDVLQESDWQTDKIAAACVGEDDDILLLESEALTLADSEGIEAALAWLQARPGIISCRQRWLRQLLMARLTEQCGRNDLALHLLGESNTTAHSLTLKQWEPELLFEVKARRLKLLRLKANRSESDKARLTAEMDSLLSGLVAIDPARAAVLCG